MSSSTEIIKLLIGGPSDFGVGWIVILVSSFVTIILALVGFSKWFYKKFSQKGEFLSKTRQLAIGMDIRNFEKILGDPVFINTLSGKLDGNDEYVFSNKFFYTQAVINSTRQVVLFSITSREKSFKPSFKIGGSGFEVTLGKTYFSQIGDNPLKIFEHYDHGGIGFYSEIHFFGRPGHYLNYAFSINLNGAGGHIYSLVELSADGTPHKPETLKRFRSDTPINTYTVIGSIDPEDVPLLILGPRTGQIWNLND
ncbi:hypothetical protein K2Q08_02335 [Patescibacteria group bacterium]|nr:hypothetical protein [Patescibacteria group bacterium]